jgi:hypothetical protein
MVRVSARWLALRILATGVGAGTEEPTTNYSPMIDAAG